MIKKLNNIIFSIYIIPNKSFYLFISKNIFINYKKYI